MAFTSKRRPKQLFEKIVIVTDAVYGCIYCSWLDAKLAIKSGISEQEIIKILQLEFHSNATEFELPALLYAQHYAETHRKSDPEMTKGLFDFYGEKMAKRVILMIRTVSFGNLYFNTWGAIISRLKGNPAPKSSVIFEFFYFLFNFWIIIPFVILRKLDKKLMEPV